MCLKATNLTINKTSAVPQATLRKKCPYSELFWSVFSRIRTEYGEILRISLYLVRIGENTVRNNSENGHFLSSAAMLHNVRLLPAKYVKVI